MGPSSLHSNFFSSLKQVEKRLKLENPTQPFNLSTPLSLQPPPLPPPPLQPAAETDFSLTESLGTPMYLHTDLDPNCKNNNSVSINESSEPPLAFLSYSLQSPPQGSTQFQSKTVNKATTDYVDDLELLIQLLGLSSFTEGNQGEEDKERVVFGGGDCCGCEGRFYEKIVGVKGPKCRKEVERLEGWIMYFSLNGGGGGGGEERREPLRLALLLLGKVAFELEGGDKNGFGGLEFPSTIEEFLKLDPPKE